MKIKVKIYGAGSIGNHLAQACRRNDWDVSVVDINAEALKRMKDEIYPKRYGVWDENIKLYEAGQELKGGFDVIMLGTPPDIRADLAFQILEQECPRPRLILLEKPLCSVKDINRFYEFKRNADIFGIIVLVGYNHALSRSIGDVVRLLKTQTTGKTEIIDVEWREHWEGIFAAHPWLAGPKDSYLGYTARGGGALGEHSHGIHLWLLLAKMSGFGEPKEISAFLDFQNNGLDFDKIAAINIRTNKGKQGRVIQDVITKPAKKWARIQGSKGFIEWECKSNKDSVYFDCAGRSARMDFPKTRADDFFAEIKHLEDLLTGKKFAESFISFDLGIKTMQIISAVQSSNRYSLIQPLI